MSGFNPSPAELALVSAIFAKADPQKIGILTGDSALKVFGGANLQPTVLGEIWSIADEDNNGWLPKKGVAIAVRLMGWAQKGEKMTQALVNRPGPLPTIDGIVVPLTQQTTGISLSKSPPPALPQLTAQDRARYNGIFQGCEKARDVFIKSKLPVEKLGQIWNLADTQNRGALDATDFAIGMYLIQASMSGSLSFIPTSLPPGLYEQAAGTSIVTHPTGGSSSFSPTPSRVQTQYTGQSALQSQITGQKRAPPVLPSRKVTTPAQFGASPFANGQHAPVPAWDVTAAEKASADRFFDTLDSQKVNYIEGDVAVPFMLQSNLPEDILAQVWDLADINNDGRLTRDGFAVAMHLIQGKLAGKEVPSTLPPSLVPPSMRSSAGSAFSAQQQAQPQPQPEPIDLLWDDTPPPSASPAPTSQSFQSSGFTAPSVSSPKQPPAAPAQDPFGSSNFRVASPNYNFLDDDEPAASPPPQQDKSAEIGNVQNQLNSTNRSLSNAKAEREPLEQTLANQAAQLSALQTQLASAKAAYETETKLLSTLKDRMAAQTGDMTKAREELIRAESDLSAVRVEKAEIEGAFMRDKEDVRELHRKMADTGTEIAGLKIEIEKAKKEAKQQKGLLAIARKQLSTKETEKAKVQKELDETHAEIQETNAEREAVEAELESYAAAPVASTTGNIVAPVAQTPETIMANAVAQPLPMSLPTSPDISTPNGSIKSNNPFDRLTRSGSTASPRARSPFMPFAEASVPTPSVISAEPVTDNVDPFGFASAFGDEAAIAQPETTTATETATPRALSPSSEHPEDDIVSPVSEAGETDFYSTPPTNAANLSQSPVPERALSDVSSAEAHFPAIDDVPGAFPMDEPRKSEETDLNGPLKEKDIEESDSDSEDEEPLSSIKHKLQSSVDNVSSRAAAPNGLSMPSTSFDDAFGESASGETLSLQTPKPPATIPTGSLGSSFASVNAPSVDAFGAPLAKSTNPFPVENSSTAAPKIADVNAFDEAMGKISTNHTGTHAPDFSFDTAFEDNFDFATATTAAPSFPPPPSAPNGSALGASSPFAGKPTGFGDAFSSVASGKAPAPAPAAPSRSFSFEDAFASTPAPSTDAAATGKSPDPSAGISFDDAFGGVESGEALKLDGAFNSISSKASAAPSPSRQGSASRAVSSLQSPPLSPQGPESPRISSIRSSSPPPRALSPPNRLGSPGPRPSTSSSSKDGHEKLKPDVPTRHSRLSIRLPFGKKKSKEAKETAPPLPPSSFSHLSPPIEEPTGATTPAVDDDVDAVKQLCGMGFSRSQAVTALEKNGYDVQKALNSLLGTA
ncbi:hypothetical protein HWV62_23989 [Athelia sp. TMB]|nr:hypothetical protein HWV62_23989 [Athelia sp. TMB]